MFLDNSCHRIKINMLLLYQEDTVVNKTGLEEKCQLKHGALIFRRYRGLLDCCRNYLRPQQRIYQEK